MVASVLVFFFFGACKIRGVVTRGTGAGAGAGGVMSEQL